MQAVILAGGLATRLYPRTIDTPKFMVQVSGRPFAAWLLERLRDSGFDDVVICIAHLGDQIRDFVGNGSKFGLSVRYEDEGKNLLGTAGALRNALKSLAPQFLVTYGDSYLPFDYSAPLRELVEYNDSDGVMSVFKNYDKWDDSNVEIRIDGAKNPWVAKYEKGVIGYSFIDYGAIALNREVIEKLPEGTVYGLDQIQSGLAIKWRLRAHVARKRFYEIGTEQGLWDLEQVLSK